MTKKLSKIGNLLDISKDFPIDADHFWSKVDKSGDCWEFQGPFNTTGYGIYHVKMPPKPDRPKRHVYQPLPAHRVAYHLGYDYVNPGKLVCHDCDNRKCCNPAHLFQGSQVDNMQDASKKKRWTKRT